MMHFDQLASSGWAAGTGSTFVLAFNSPGLLVVLGLWVVLELLAILSQVVYKLQMEQTLLSLKN